MAGSGEFNQSVGAVIFATDPGPEPSNIWTIVSAGVGMPGAVGCYKFMNQESGLYLAIDEPLPGGLVVQAADDGADIFVWCLEPHEGPLPTDPALDPAYDPANDPALDPANDPANDLAQATDGIMGVFKLMNYESSQFLTLAGDSLIQSADPNQPENTWELIPFSPGFHQIQNIMMGGMMGVAGSSQSAGAAVLALPPGPEPNMNWKLVGTGFEMPGAVGCYKIMNQNSNQYLDIDGAVPDATAVQIPEDESDSLIWCLEPGG